MHHAVVDANGLSPSLPDVPDDAYLAWNLQKLGIRREHALFEDCMQEARLSYTKHPELKRSDRYQRARWDVIDFLRRWQHHRKDQGRESPSVRSLEEMQELYQFDVSEDFEEPEEDYALAEAIRSVARYSERMATIYRLRLAGLTYTKIGKVLNLSESYVCQLAHKGRGHLPDSFILNLRSTQ